jgi:hypothetical protein
MEVGFRVWEERHHSLVNGYTSFRVSENPSLLQTTSFAMMLLNFDVLIFTSLLYFEANRGAAKKSAFGLFLQLGVSAGRRETRWKPLHFESASLS